MPSWTAPIAILAALTLSACCRSPKIVYQTAPSPNCLQSVGTKPTLDPTWVLDLTPTGCDEDRFDACFVNIGPLIRYVAQAGRYMTQVEEACKEANTEETP